jgi:outer membrane protein assembly factor BamB
MINSSQRMTLCFRYSVWVLGWGLVVAALTNATNAQDWPQFRGPDGNGVLAALAHPLQWSNDKNLAWSAELSGSGLASPIVVGDRIFLTTAIGADPSVSFAAGVADMKPKTPTGPVQFTVQSYSLENGNLLWSKSLLETQPQHPIHGSNSYATETPASDGQRLYVYFAAVGLVAAMDFAGQELWRRDVGAYPTGNGFGTGSSLAMGDGRIYIQCDNEASSFVAAFDGATGAEVWRQARAGKTSWATPLFWKNSQRSELVTCGEGVVTSYNPATGEELWAISGISASFSGSPATEGDRLFFGNSGPMSSGPLLSVAAGLSGRREFKPRQENEGVAWFKMQAGPGMASPVSVAGNLYISGRGRLSCYDANSGEVKYRERIQLETVAASMWAAGDRVFLLDETGKTLVVQVGDEYQVVATNELKDDLFWSTPAVAGNSLLIRGVKRLYCIRQ